MVGPSTRAQLRVAVIGCGGLGVPAAWTLALDCVGQITLVDADVVDESNLHRQVLYSVADIGKPKVHALAARLRAMAPALRIHAIERHADASLLDDLAREHDGLMEGSDDGMLKLAASDAAVRGGRVASIAAAIGRMGQLFVVDARADSRGACYRCLFEDGPDPALLQTCAVAGVLGAVTGLVGSLAARSLVRVLEGREDPARSALCIYEGYVPRMRRVGVERDPRCSCSLGHGA